MVATQETYAQMRSRHQKEYNDFPLGAAFSKEQFREQMEKWGLSENDTDKVVSIGYGCFIRKSDAEAFNEMNARHRKEEKDAIAADETGEGFIKGMFYYELANHEYGYTGDDEDAIHACGFAIREVYGNPVLYHGLELAKKEIMRDTE